MQATSTVAAAAVGAAAGAAVAAAFFYLLRRAEKPSAPVVLSDSGDRARAAVAAAYEATAKGSASCCVTAPDASARTKIGYTAEDRALGEKLGADLGVGCGTPVYVADPQPGEVLCDLGAGAGFDVLLAAKKVGAKGMAIGIDMVPAMLERARGAAHAAGLTNAQFRLGEIEHLPLPDAHADVVVSNCVINLSPDKRQVCREAFRVLKPGGRLAVSDVVRTQELPERLKNEAALACWVAGAPRPDDLAGALRDAGFEQVPPC